MSKSSINLPKTAFSMKANLPTREPEILDYWKKINLYDQLRKLTHLNSKVLDHLMDEIFNWGGYALTLKSSNFRKKVRN